MRDQQELTRRLSFRARIKARIFWIKHEPLSPDSIYNERSIRESLRKIQEALNGNS